MKHGEVLRILAFLLCCVAPTYAQTAPDPVYFGEWSDLKSLSADPEDPNQAVQCVHAIVLHNGKVLCSAVYRPGDPPARPQNVLFDPATDSVSVASQGSPNQHNLFCSGHVTLADGRVLFGHGGSACKGNYMTTFYEPAETGPGTFTRGPDEPGEGQFNRTWRWYPTLTTLGNGSVLVFDGDCPDPGGPLDNGIPTIPAILRPSKQDPTQWTWQHLTGADYGTHTDEPFTIAYYQYMFLLSDGKIFQAGSHYTNHHPTDENGNNLDPDNLNLRTRKLDTALETWEEIDIPSIKGGSAVMYARDRILKAGGGMKSTNSSACAPSEVTNEVVQIDFTDASPAWAALAPCTTSACTSTWSPCPTERSSPWAARAAHRTPRPKAPPTARSKTRCSNRKSTTPTPTPGA